MASLFNASDILTVIRRWKRPLGLIVLASVILSAVFSGPSFIKPKYRSFVILYLSNIIPYGTETPTEQALQLLQSGDIRQEIIRKFDLMKHYGIDSMASPFPVTELNEEFDDNISFRKTEYESVEIVVYDTDPKVAADIANSFVDLLNAKARHLQREKSAEVVVITRREMEKKKQEVDSLEMLVAKGGKTAIAAGPVSAEKQLQLVARDQYAALTSENLWKARTAYNELKILYEVAVRDVEKELTYSNVVTQASPAEKKSYPIRWLIVLLSALSVFFLSVTILIMLENYKTGKA